MSDKLRIATVAERSDLDVGKLEAPLGAGWPPFVLADPVAERYWDRVLGDFGAWQLLAFDDAGELAAVGHSVPFHWSGHPPDLPGGWDAVLTQAVADHDAGRAPTALAGLSVTVAETHRGRGLSRQLVEALRAAAAAGGLADLVIPVRPTLKHRYPLIPMEQYLGWTRPGGRPFDPWLGVHLGLGAELLGVCPASMVVTAPVARWEEWTGLALPGSGRHVVPGALVPVEVDLGRDEGRYVEPNVWVRHRLGGQGRVATTA
jgi:GNAT superfamily N-acetyltransferase